MSGSDHLRRLALQIAAQLPEAEIEALGVLKMAGDLVRHVGVLSVEEPEATPVWRAARSPAALPGGAEVIPLGLRGRANPE